MSDAHENENVPVEPGAGGIEAMPVEEPRRAASITLREADAREARSASMEAANQSLTDALRIVYRLLQFVMIGLVVLFAFSGLQQVNEGEVGMKVSFGRVTAERLEPGFQFSFPYPLGEIVKIPTSTVTLEVLNAFWPQGLDPARPADQQGFGKQSLEPGVDGSLLTADFNIAHAQVAVSYHRADPVNYTKNLYRDHETSTVRAAVERATVHIAAGVLIDDLLKRALSESPAGEGRENSLESRIRDEAQRMLDTMESGIRVDRVVLREVRPPQRTAQAFRQVNDSVTTAAKEREEADRERSEQLTGVAGSAFQPLLDLIDETERRLALGDTEGADEVLSLINAIFDGTYDGTTVLNGVAYPPIQIAGEVAQRISEAQQYRSTSVARARTRAETFRAKLAQYRANPKVALSYELMDAYSQFLKTETVQTFFVPTGTEPLTIKIGPDPDFAREIERAIKRRDLEENERRRRALQAGRP